MYRNFPLFAVAILLVSSQCLAAGQVSDFQHAAAVAQDVEVGGSLLLNGLNLDATRPNSTLRLHRIEAFTEGARIVVDQGTPQEKILMPPDNRYFVGQIEGELGSSVLLDFRATGDIRGFITLDGEYWMIGGLGESGVLQTRKVDVATELAGTAQQFSCGADQLTSPVDLLGNTFRGFVPPSPTPAPSSRVAGGVPSYTARIGIDTDIEFYNLFGNTTDATDYIGDIIAYLSQTYSTEIDTSMLVETIFLYTTAGADPWTQTSTSCLLFEFGRYWNDNNTGVDRTIAHFMSGKNNGGGVAWVGVLCNGAFNYAGGASSGCPGLTPDTDNYGGDYGYTGTMDGDFNINSPQVLWDVVATAHEIGHNFNSPHTHCYAGLGGNANDVDHCYGSQSGCFSGTPVLPGPQGAGSGTIMSYCHLRPGGMTNVTFTFGEGHAWGTAPERVGQRMNNHVVSTAGSNPACLAYTVNGSIFADGFESGDTTAW